MGTLHFGAGEPLYVPNWLDLLHFQEEFIKQLNQFIFNL